MPEMDDALGRGLGGIDLEEVRKTAYFLWEQEGRPEGRAQDFWQRALVQHIRHREYQGWLEEGHSGRGAPDGEPS